jgi:hypothetical protein
MTAGGTVLEVGVEGRGAYSLALFRPMLSVGVLEALRLLWPSARIQPRIHPHTPPPPHPDLAAAAAAPSAKLPWSSTQVPRSSREVPQHSTEGPRRSTEVSQHSTEDLRHSTEVPQPSTDVPQHSTEAPRPSMEVPRYSTDVSRHSTEAPRHSAGFHGDVLAASGDVDSSGLVGMHLAGGSSEGGGLQAGSGCGETDPDQTQMEDVNQTQTTRAEVQVYDPAVKEAATMLRGARIRLAERRKVTLLHIRSPIFSRRESPGMGGLEYPSPYATAGRKRRPKGAMAKVPGVCLIWRCSSTCSTKERHGTL